MILYYPTNVFVSSSILFICFLQDNTRITNLTRQLFPGAGALWIGVTCVDKSDCYTEKGEAIRVGTHLGLYENFFGSGRILLLVTDVISFQLWGHVPNWTRLPVSGSESLVVAGCMHPSSAGIPKLLVGLEKI